MKNTDLLKLITKTFYNEINAAKNPADLLNKLVANCRTIEDEIWNEAYWKGNEEGHKQGYYEGYDAGKEDGYIEGYGDWLNE